VIFFKSLVVFPLPGLFYTESSFLQEVKVRAAIPAAMNRIFFIKKICMVKNGQLRKRVVVLVTLTFSIRGMLVGNAMLVAGQKTNGTEYDEL
jgi:hypothetical protein